MKSFNVRFEFIIATVIVLFFILLQPKLSVVLFPQKREIILNNFISDVKINNKINSRTFWKFREFYYPGYFKLEKNGFSQTHYSDFTHKLTFSFIKNEHPLVFLLYRSGKVNSIEALVDKGTLHEVLVDNDNSQSQILFNNKTSLIKKSGTKIQVFFIKPMSDMILTNGYYDYKNPRDRAIIEDRYWLSISEIETN